MTISTLVKDVIFPIFCLGCEKEGQWVCDNCASIINTTGVFCCPLCHRETERGFACDACREKSHLSSHAAVTIYREDALAGKMIRAYKYSYAEEILDVMRRYLASFFSSHASLFFSIDVIVPVPLHPRRTAERGFNQAELLAHAVQQFIGKPFSVALRRGRYTSPQALLAKTARLKNVQNAFQLNAMSDIRGARVLLVDDVFTTGATMQECARVLLEAGASDVAGMSVARG